MIQKLHINQIKCLYGASNSKFSNTGFTFRTPESFLDSLKNDDDEVDLSKYKAGIRVFHKKFGEGIINYVEKEGKDLKVDIQFDKAGHKRLMAKYANLKVI